MESGIFSLEETESGYESHLQVTEKVLTIRKVKTVLSFQNARHEIMDLILQEGRFRLVVKKKLSEEQYTEMISYSSMSLFRRI